MILWAMNFGRPVIYYQLPFGGVFGYVWNYWSEKIASILAAFCERNGILHTSMLCQFDVVITPHVIEIVIMI